MTSADPSPVGFAGLGVMGSAMSGHLLRAGVHAMIAVVIRANTIHELGATEPYFFGEDILFSPQPPCVVDFLSEDLVITYRRPKLFKTIRIQIEETLEPFNGSYQSTSENPGVHQ